jgi:hypothetical protein
LTQILGQPCEYQVPEDRPANFAIVKPKTPASTVASTSLGAVCHRTLTTWRAGIMAAWDHLGTSGNMEGYLD